MERSDQKRRHIMPSLSSMPSKLDELYRQHGGPLDLPGTTLDRSAFEDATERVSYEDIADAVHPWIEDEVALRRAWPWLAFAVKQYRFERKERGGYADELKPTEVKESFARMASLATKLRHELSQLRIHSHRLYDPKKPEARGHLGYLHEFFKQRIFIEGDTDFIDDPAIWVATDFQQGSLESILATVARAADEFSVQHVDASLLNRTRGQDDPALPNIAALAAKVWTALTGRVASTNKVHHSDDGEKSEFVKFVGALVKLAGEPEPTRAEVAKALA